jgi:hypothetical protein
MRRVEGPEDRFELGVMWVDDDFGRVETEPLPPACLEPIWVLRADQRDDATRCSRSFELKDCARIGWNAGARHRQLSPRVDNRKRVEESRAYVSTRTSADENASQANGRLHANEFRRSRAEEHSEPPAPCSHLEHSPSFDFELREDARMNGLNLAEGIPKLRLELIHHRPEQSSTEPLGRFCVAVGGRLAFSGGDRDQVLDWQPSDIMEAEPLPARRSRGSGLEVIHFYVDLRIWG